MNDYTPFDENQTLIKSNGHKPYTEYYELPDDVDELRRLMVSLGGNPTAKSFFKKLDVVKQQAYAEIQTQRARQDEQRHSWSRWAATFIGVGMDIIAVVFSTVFVLGGLLFGTMLLFYAEVVAVKSGFDAIDPHYALLYSTASVSFFIVLLFIREVIARDATDEPQRVFSLRYLYSWVLYLIGFGKSWEARYKYNPTLLRKVESAIKWLTWTIVLFGLLGRLMENVNGLQYADGRAMIWTDALQNIIYRSTLPQLFGYIGAPLMTFALLLATHFVVYFIHRLFVKVTGGLEIANFTQDFSPDLIIYGAEVRLYQDEILRLMEKNG